MATVVLIALFACEQTQPHAQQPGRAQAPVTLPAAGPDTLGLDRPIAPLTGPVTVGQGSWLPFTRFCEVKRGVLGVGGQAGETSGTICATIATEPVKDGWRRMTATVTEGSLTGASLVAEYSSARQVRGASYKPPPAADLSTQGARVDNQILDDTLRKFLLPDPVTIARQAEPFHGSLLQPYTEGTGSAKDIMAACRVEGQSAVAGRGVVVTSCTLGPPFSYTDRDTGVVVAGATAVTVWLASDIASGAGRRMVSTIRMDGTSTEAGRSSPFTITNWFSVTLD